MKERGIVMGAESVRAILDGSKTQTRRVMTPQPTTEPGHGLTWRGGAWGAQPNGEPFLANILRHCPYGRVGDRLWVRETWCPMRIAKDGTPSVLLRRAKVSARNAIVYRAEGRPDGEAPGMPWRSPIFMPRWASRVLLEVEGVRLHKLDALSHGDAVAEGFPPRPGRAWGRLAFSQAWDALNAVRGFAWAANPWVWAITFRRLEPAADTLHSHEPPPAAGATTA